jgi:hypothetical protein
MKSHSPSQSTRTFWLHKLTLCSLLIGVVCLALSTDASRAGGADSYSASLMRLKHKDLTIDFGALRRAYAQTPDYHPDDPAMIAMRREMDRDFDSGDRGAAIRIARQLLARDYIDIDAHRILERSAVPCADFHRAVADRLTQSILDSGDGKTPATAYRVLSIDEEYAVLDHLGLQAAAQSLLEQQGHHYDSLLVPGDAGKPFNVYFTIDLSFAASTNGETE